MDKTKLDLESENRFVQFQIWRDCPINCEFCYNKGIIPTKDKVKNLEWIKDLILHDPVVSLYNEIGLIGGETYGKELDDEGVRESFFDLIDVIIQKILDKKVKKVYITTSLIFKEFDDLLETFRRFDDKGVLGNLLICTSYDTVYRFKNKNSEKLWFDNVKKIHEHYPKANVHVETIVTEDFCQKVINKEFDIKKFENEYNVTIDFIEPNVNDSVTDIEDFNKRLPLFLPKRKTFFRFLNFCKENNLINWEFLFNPYLHSDLLFIEFEGKPYIFDGRRKRGIDLVRKFGFETLKRKFFYSRYQDSEKSIIDDTMAYKESIGEA